MKFDIDALIEFPGFASSWQKPTPQGVDPRPFNQHFEEEWSDLSGLNHDMLQKPRRPPLKSFKTCLYHIYIYIHTRLGGTAPEITPYFDHPILFGASVIESLAASFWWDIKPPFLKRDVSRGETFPSKSTTNISQPSMYNYIISLDLVAWKLVKIVAWKLVKHFWHAASSIFSLVMLSTKKPFNKNKTVSAPNPTLDFLAICVWKKSHDLFSYPKTRFMGIYKHNICKYKNTPVCIYIYI